jgi:hypothetical protein
MRSQAYVKIFQGGQVQKSEIFGATFFQFLKISIKIESFAISGEFHAYIFIEHIL